MSTTTAERPPKVREPKIGCGYPGCQTPINHRPYAGKRDMPSGSTVAGMGDNAANGFAWAAAGIAASTAVHHPDTWTGLATDGCTEDKTGFCPACRFLRSEHDRRWKAKATLGTHVHHLVDSLALGHEVDEDDTTRPYLDAWTAWHTAHSPVFELTEFTVLYDKPSSLSYRGQSDAICTLDCPVHLDQRCRWWVDWKTGSYHPVTQTLQLAGYRHAQHLTDWSSGAEVITGKVPTVAHAGVVLLGADGTQRMVELPADGDAHGTFLRLRDLWSWQKRMRAWEREHPLASSDDETEQA